jgi:hypothetical protein
MMKNEEMKRTEEGVEKVEMKKKQMNHHQKLRLKKERN